MKEKKPEGCKKLFFGNAVERSFRQALTPFEEFVHDEASSGLLLMACTVVAMLIANSNLLPLYEAILHTQITIGSADYNVSHSLHH